MQETVLSKIVKDPEICGGKAILSGTRIRVLDIVEMYEELEYSPERIAAAFELTLSQVHAALTYYYEHPKEIEKDMKEAREFIKELKKWPNAKGVERS